MEQNNLNSPLTNSLQQSYYIAALDRFLGIRGLVSPVVQQHEGKDYVFDFYHQKSKLLIKFFTTADVDFMEWDLSIPEDLHQLYIFDVGHLLTGTCPRCDGICAHLVPLEIRNAAAVLESRLYFDDALWEPDYPEGEEDWHRMLTIERHRCVDLILNGPGTGYEDHPGASGDDEDEEE